MSTAAITPATQGVAINSPLDTHWGKLLIPSLSDFFFLALVVWLFGVGEGWKGLVLDGDTGWHIRTGEYILNSGSVPHQDIFSYSKPGADWYAWEWLTDVQYALLHARWGLGGVAVFSGLIICASAYTLLRTMLWTGANVFAALVLTLLYVGGSSLHHHARPHVWTLLLFAVSTGLLARDRRQQTKLIWLLIPLTAVWTNLHGGFLALIACTGLAAIGGLLEKQSRNSLRYFFLTGGCLAASLLNPYGIQLHIHVAEYLRSDFIRNVVQEFQSPTFRTESARQFEAVLVLGILCAGLLASRKRFTEALWILYFAHEALSSARHIPLYMIVAAPAIATEATGRWNAFFAHTPKNSIRGIFHSLAADVSIGFRRTTFWIAAAAIPVVGITAAAHWPSDFAKSFPIQMISRHRDRIAGPKLFTSDQWGDYILYKMWPQQKVFIDGRSDFYGEAIGKEYLSLMNADFHWNSVINKHGFERMLLPVSWPLASILKASPQWSVIADDGVAILFERRALQP